MIGVLPVELHVEPDVGSARDVHVGRCHAENRHAAGRQRKRLSDDLRIAAEHTAPHAMRENHTVRAVLAEVVGRETASDREREVEERKEALIHARGDDRHRRGVAQQREVDARGHRRVDDRHRRIPQPADFERSHQPARHPSVGERRSDGPEILRVRIRQRSQQRGVGDAEDRRRGADAECQRADGSKRKRGRASKRAHRVSHVLSEDVQPADPTLLANLFFDLIEPAKIPARRRARVRRRETVTAILRGDQFQVRLDFLREIGVAA